jgi:alkanesulfonate monooxygenase SsuD/methylene tetrahydromethanopterin reductase-like flavin-dependent oxidoreductase (luciferase family)
MRFGLMWFNSPTPYALVDGQAERNPDVLDPQVQARLARAAEDAGFDFLFLADRYQVISDASSRIGHGDPFLAANSWAPILMAATSRIGVATTMHTRYLSPAVIARIGANLDTISGGRWAWNVVPGTVDDELMGVPPLPHEDRYRYTTEVVGLVKALWAARGDRVDLSGEFHSLRGRMMGPHIVQQPAPPLFNAGVSDAGLELIAAECDYGFFTVVDDLAKVRTPVERIAGLAADRGRDPHAVTLVGSVGVLVDDDPARAADRLAELERDLDPAAATGWAQSFLARSHTYRSTHGDEEIRKTFGLAGGSRVLCGTPQDVAEQIFDVHRQTGLRGFQILPLTWSVDEIARIGNVFAHLERTGCWEPPARRDWSW